MSSRLAGALLALIAAALLALSIVTSAWWSGHPEVEGRTIDAKSVFVGLHGAEGCNTGGDGACTTLELPGAFVATGYAELGVSGLATLAALALALLTLQGSDGRKGMANALIGFAALSIVVAIALIVQGPKIRTSQHIAIPMGYGTFVFFGGAVAAVLGAILARRELPKLQPRPSRARIAPAQHAIDPYAQTQAQSQLPGPAGPLAPPLFDAAPQLRPLYETAPAIGGTHGYVPHAPASLPALGPAPVPRAQVSAYAGIPTPPPVIDPPRPKPPSMPPPAPRPNLPPAPRTAQGPALPGRAARPQGGAEVRSTSVPPPPAAPRARAGTQPPPPGAIAARLKASSVPPPVRPASQSVAKAPEAPAAAPTTPKTLAGAAIPAKPSSPKLPVRAETDPADHLETVEREKDAAELDDAGDTTDTTAAPAPDAETTSSEPIDPPLDTEQGPVVRPETESDAAETNAIPKQDVAIAAPVTEPTPATANPTPEAPKIPLSTAPDSLPPPKQAATTSGPTPACPQCEAPMAWVEEHLRFYCKSCRMYF